MVCSLCVTPYGSRGSLQGISCGREVLNNLINAGTGRCVSLGAAYASMFSTLVMRVMDACIFAWRVIHAASRRRGAMVVAVLMLPHLAQLSVVVLSTPVVMCSSGDIFGAKMWRWAMYASSSRSLMVKKPWGFSSVIIMDRMAVLNVSRHTCHSPEGI